MGEENQQPIGQAETKKCPKCKEEIQKDATLCKHCGAKIVSSGRKKFGIGCLIALLIIIALIIGSDSDDSTSSSSSTQNNETVSQEKDTKKDEAIKSEKNDDIPLLGDEFILKYDEETKNKIFIVDTEENYVALMKSSLMKDTEGSTEIFKKHVISVDNGTRVRVIDYVKSDEGITYKGIKVRVLEGDKYNSVGYATRPFLRPIENSK